MADFLLELLSEEIPARMHAKARNELARLFAERTGEAGLTTGPIDVYSTPRRLALIARNVAAATEASREELKGPRTSAPPQALEGFLRKTGLTKDQLEERDGIYFATIERAGRPASQILSDAVRHIVADFPWPKSMRWADGDLRWVRPLHGIVALLGDEIVPVEIGGITSGASTVGHRFHHPGDITIGGAHDYVEKLRACHVIVDQEERERIVRDGAAAAAKQAGLTLIGDEGLVVENAGLTEWPVPLVGRFDAEFLDVPREVVVLTMRTNQKYFACTNDEGLLAPAFVCVANIAANDGGKAIAEGNARVLAARLADARFFWEQDLKIPLEEQAKKLDGIVFHEKLGTVADKVERVAQLARWLVESGVVKADVDQVERAARLAKADLVTGMVGEFPELQGVIGGYLAAAQGEPQAVPDAIRDHYKPVGQGDEVQSAPVTVAVALADKLDTLMALFCIGEMPTGSKDPFALRRAALGAIRLVLENGVRIKLSDALQELRDLVRNQLLVRFAFVDADLVGGLLASDASFSIRETDIGLSLFHGDTVIGRVNPEYLRSMEEWDKIDEVIWEGESKAADFFADRLKVQQRDFGVRHDLISAAFSLSAGPFSVRDDDLVRLLARVNALQAFVETEDGADLLTAYKRAANILKKENWTGQVLTSPGSQGIPQTGEEDPLVLVDDPILGEAIAEMASGHAGADLPQEQALVAALDAAEPKASTAVDAEDFTAAMAALASLRKPIDEFFDHVTVNDPDPAKRERRLNLLMRFRDAVNRVADFSKIEG